MNLSSALALVLLTMSQDPPAVALEVGHVGFDCEDERQGLTCREKLHFRYWINGKEVRSLEDTIARLRELSGGGASIDRKILFRPNAKTPFQWVWSTIVACRKARCTRLSWWEENSPEPAPSGKNAPLDVLIRIDDERLQGTEARVEEGPWSAKTSDTLAALRRTSAGAQTRLIIDADGDLPWSDISRIEEMCRRQGFAKIEFLGIAEEASAAVTEADARVVAKNLHDAPDEEAAGMLDRLVDRQELFRRATRGIELSGKIRHLVFTLASSQFPSGRLLRKSPLGTKALKFIRLRVTDGEPRAVFRLLAGGGLDYVEFVLAKDPSGNVRIVDVASMSQGGLTTDIFRDFYLGSPKHLKILNQLRAPTPLDLFWFEGKYGEMVHLAAEGKAKEAFQVAKGNLEELKRYERAMRVYLNLAKIAGAESYGEAIADFEKCFPKSPSVPILRMDGCMVRGDRDGALKAMDEIDGRVDGDPYLDVLRARVHVFVKDLSGAKASADRATRLEPGLSQGWWTLVDVLMKQKDFKGAADKLTAMESTHRFPLAELEKLPEYADFAASPEYRLWMESRKK